MPPSSLRLMFLSQFQTMINMLFNPFMPRGLLYLNSLDGSISKRGGLLFFICPGSIGIPISNDKNVDPDQMPHSAASDLGLHCLPMSLLWDARHKWVKSVDNSAIALRVFFNY